MEEVHTFGSSDATFMLVHNGFITELSNLGRLRIEGYRTVQTASCLKGNHKYHEYLFRSWYDFARTAQSVLRMLMLEASGMRRLFDPKFSEPGKRRNLASIDVDPIVPAPNAYIDMAQAVPERAMRIAAEFDRLYPHYFIQSKVKDMVPGQTISLPGLMYVIDFNQRFIYHIATTMDVKFVNFNIYHNNIPTTKPEAMVVEAGLYVAVWKYSFDDLCINPEDSNKLTRYWMLRNLIDEFKSVNPGLAHDGMSLSKFFQQFNVDDNEDNDDIEQGVAAYFHNSF